MSIKEIFADGKKLGVYIHIPFCKSKCKYCAFVSTPDLSLQNSYVDALVGEIGSVKDAKLTADTVYIGGGTPSCLPHGALTRIFDALYGSMDIDKNAEITVEANPESCTEEFADECAAAGVNRVSLGLQSSDDGVLKAIGRIHTVADFVKAIKTLENKGFSNISSDMILGLPHQTESDVKRAISMISDCCAHASVYALNVEENTPLYTEGYRPDDDMVADMYALARAELSMRGFLRYEVSNFARDGKCSRHNSKYWACEPYIGFGAAAHGYDGDGVRFYHSDDICEYIAERRVYINALTPADKFNEYVMLALRTERGIDENAFAARFGRGIYGARKEAIDKLISQSALARTDGRIFIPPEKLFVMNGIIEELMLDSGESF